MLKTFVTLTLIIPFKNYIIIMTTIVGTINSISYTILFVYLSFIIITITIYLILYNNYNYNVIMKCTSKFLKFNNNRHANITTGNT